LLAKVFSTFFEKEIISSALKCLVSPEPVLAELNPAASAQLLTSHKLKKHVIILRIVGNQFLGVVGCCSALFGGRMDTVSSVMGSGLPIGREAESINDPPACTAALPRLTAPMPLAKMGVAMTPEAN
jgi:hypothetical protein